MKKKFLSKLLTMLLVVSMMFTMLPASAIAYYDGGWSGWRNSWWDSWWNDSEDVTVDEQDAEMEIATQAVDNSEFLRIFHLDCGRKYFSVDEIYGIIDELAKNHYTHIELAFGNEGLRFVLNEGNMAVGNHSGSDVVAAIASGNQTYDSTQRLNYKVDAWTEDDMNDILDYAKGEGIEVIPMFDIPGHMNAVISAMKTLDIDVDVFSQVGKKYPGNIGQSFDPTNETAVAFAKGLVENYISYFAGNDCKYFNIAGDECGFAEMNSAQYDAYIQLMNDLNTSVKAKDMTTMMFNDGVYYTGKNVKGYTGQFDKDIVICYWTGGDNYQTSTALQDKGFKLINTNVHWYYVAGNEYTNSNEMFYYNYATKNMESKKCTECDGGGAIADTGCMLAFWCDNPTENVNSNNLKTYIKTLADNNPDYFKASTRVDPEQPSEQFTLTLGSSDLTVGDSATVTANKDVTEWASSNEEVATIERADTNSATLTAVGEGATTITATDADGNTATVGINVKAGDVSYEERTITVTVGQTVTDPKTISGDYSGAHTTENEMIATVAKAKSEYIPGASGDPVKQTTLISGQKYIISDGNGNYLKRNGTSLENTQDPDDATEWMIESNTQNGVSVWNIKSDNYFLSYYNGRWGLNLKTGNGQISWAYSNGGFKYFDGNYYLRTNNNNQWTVGSTNSRNGGAYTKGQSTEGGYQTTVTFKGVSGGTTYVTIGNVHYTIHVSKEDLGNAPTLPIQLWITSQTIQVDQNGMKSKETSEKFNGAKAQYLEVSATAALNTSKGVPLSECVPMEIKGHYEEGGTWWIDQKDGKQPFDFLLWKGVVLDKNFQEVWGKSRINAGTDFQYVRYYNGEWAVTSTPDDEDSWTAVTGEGSKTSTSGCKQQIVAYYYMQTKLTKDVTTNVVDWGDPYESYKNINSSGSDGGYVLLDFAVKTETGSIDPDLSAFPMMQRTLAYHCNGETETCGTANGVRYRRIDQIEAVNTSDHEIYMITLTPTNDTASKQLEKNCADNPAGSGIYKGTEKVVWVKSVGDLQKAGFDDESLWYTSPSGETKFTSSDTSGKYVGGKAELKNVEIYYKQGLLVTYYVRSTAEYQVTVHYIDQRTRKEFHSLNISVLDDTTYFNPKFGMLGDELINNTVNGINHVETVIADLSKLPLISAEYRRINYKLVAANLGENKEQAKDAYLYYTFDNTESFVVDFGLPLTIEPADVGNLNGATITDAVVKGVDEEQAEVTVTQAGVVTYKLLKPLGENPDTFTVAYTGRGVDGSEKESATVEFMFYIYPASNVLYEENFLTQGKEESAGRITRHDWDETTFKSNKVQKTQKVNGDGTYNVFGYDGAYAGINSAAGYWRATGLNSDSDATKSLNTTFYGNGIDVIGSCGPNTGLVLVTVKNSKNEAVAGALIDTRYTKGTIDQVPLAHLMLENEATYTATIYAYAPLASSTNSTSSTKSAVLRAPSTASYALIDGTADSSGLITDAIAADLAAEGLSVADLEIVSASEAAASVASVQSAVQTYALTDDTAAVDDSDDSANTVTIDGFRVYRSADNAAYQNLSSEYQMTYKNILTVMNGQVIKAYYENGELECSVSEYEKNGGPQKEIYLTEDQFVSFKLMKGDAVYTDPIQVSLSAVTNGTTASYKLNSSAGTIDSTVEMYYTVTPDESGIVTIANEGDDLLAIGNVKLPDGVSYSAPGGSAYSVEEAKAAVMALLSTPVDPEPEQPQAFEPEHFSIRDYATRLFRSKLVTLRIDFSGDVSYVTIDGVRYNPSRLAGWFGYHTVTFTDTIGRNDEYRYEVVFYDANGNPSETQLVYGK